MKASELKARTDAVRDSKQTGLQQQLRYEMKRASDEGCYYIYWYFKLLPQTIELLREEEFEVKIINDRNDTTYQISWM